MANVVIIGASTGGLPCAYDMRKTLGKSHKITVISDNKNFTFIPSNPWVAVGWRNTDDISFELAPKLKRKKIDFIHGTATKINPDENTVIVDGNTTVEYDYLVLATGPKLAFEEVEGLGPDGNTASVCTTHHAKIANEDFEEFCKNGGGPIVVGAAAGASCYGPAYEFVAIMDRELKNRKIRDKCPITFVTSEPYIGHLGLGGVGDSRGLLECQLRKCGIKWITNAKTISVDKEKLVCEEIDTNGEVAKTHEVPAKYTMMLPAFKGVDVVQDLANAGEGYVNPRGFVMINEYQQSPVKENIFALGVCVAIAPIEATPVPCGAPKTGYMIESMVTAICHNVEEMIDGKKPSYIPTWNAVCIADMGDTGVGLVAIPQIPPRNAVYTFTGKSMHWAKVAYEKFFIWNMKRGKTEPIYQKYIFKMMGINRLKK